MQSHLTTNARHARALLWAATMRRTGCISGWKHHMEKASEQRKKGLRGV